MVRLIQDVIAVISSFRLIPHWIIFNIHPSRKLLYYDLDWIRDHCFYWRGRQMAFLQFMTFSKEYRNTFYCRLGKVRFLIQWMCPPLNSLFIGSETTIGKGLYIQHGIATIINAHKIGESCWINQQVTVGSDGIGTPTLGDNVRIAPGAKVLGKITVGNNVFIAANAVVVKNVPDNCTVAGVPARIIKRNGVRVDEKL